MDGVPVRTCVGCRAKRPQIELIRIARTRDGRVAVDVRGAPGRGAYLCPEPACIDRALHSDALGRALKYRGTMPADGGAGAVGVLPEGLREMLLRIARTLRKEADG